MVRRPHAASAFAHIAASDAPPSMAAVHETGRSGTAEVGAALRARRPRGLATPNAVEGEVPSRLRAEGLRLREVHEELVREELRLEGLRGEDLPLRRAGDRTADHLVDERNARLDERVKSRLDDTRDARVSEGGLDLVLRERVEHRAQRPRDLGAP